MTALLALGQPGLSQASVRSHSMVSSFGMLCLTLDGSDRSGLIGSPDCQQFSSVNVRQRMSLQVPPVTAIAGQDYKHQTLFSPIWRKIWFSLTQEILDLWIESMKSNQQRKRVKVVRSPTWSSWSATMLSHCPSAPWLRHQFRGWSVRHRSQTPLFVIEQLDSGFRSLSWPWSFDTCTKLV